jgi:hypothetical protein
MNLRYHGLKIETPGSGQLCYGTGQLINRCEKMSWLFEKDLTETIRDPLKRFNNRAYSQCATKCNDTVHKMNKAVSNLSHNIEILGRRKQVVPGGAAIAVGATDEISYHLDSLLSYLRILADCISFAIPFFYKTTESIANRSFRDHRRWFTETKPEFDPEYTLVLRDHSQWFDKLSGKDPKGVRDLMMHNFGTYQLGTTCLPNGTESVTVYLITSKGIVDQDLTFTINDIINDFFCYLDKTYSLFGIRLADELSPYITSDLEGLSIFMKTSGTSDLRKKYGFYPLIE